MRIHLGRNQRRQYQRTQRALPYQTLLIEEFTTDEAAPLVTPRECEPGPGSWAIVDTGDKLSTGGGELSITGGNGAKDPRFCSVDIYSRMNGLALVMQGTLASRSWFGWYIDADQVYRENTLRNNYGTWSANYGTSSTEIVPGGTITGLAIVLRTTGAWYYWRIDGTWETAYTDATRNTASLYAGYEVNTSAVQTIEKIEIAQLLTGVDVDTAKSYLEGIWTASYVADTITLSDVLTAFSTAMTGTAIGIYRSGDDYWLWQDLGGTRYLHLRLRYTTLHSLEDAEIRDGKTQGDSLLQDIFSDSSVWEYVLNDADGWMGNRHGRETQTDLTIQVDGVLKTLGAGDSEEGSTSVVVTRTSEWLLDGGGKCADCTMTYTVTPSGGLVVSVSATFTDTFVNAGGYDGMFPFDEFLNLGSWVGAKREYDLTGDAGLTYSYTGTNAIYAVDEDGDYAVLLYTSDSRDGSGNIQDRSGGSFNKMYHAAAQTTYNATDTYTFENTYQIAYLADVNDLIR